jgi:hypothetical protein
VNESTGSRIALHSDVLNIPPRAKNALSFIRQNRKLKFLNRGGGLNPWVKNKNPNFLHSLPYKGDELK